MGNPDSDKDRAKKYTPDLIAKIKAQYIISFEAKREMAEEMLWDLKWSTIHECWEHCHGGVTNLEREKTLGKLRQKIADAQGEISVLDDGGDSYNDCPELMKFYDSEMKKLDKEIAKMYLDLDY